MKKNILFFLILLTMVGCLCLSGCSKNVEVSVHTDFLELISQRDFALAYELISPEAKRKISLEAFQKRYEIMFNELGIESLVVDNMSLRLLDQNSASKAVGGPQNTAEAVELPLDIDAADKAKPLKAPKAEYNLHYVLPDDELSYYFEMPLVTESNKWYVDWSPSLVVPDMTWGDTLRVVRIPAKRGEMFVGDDVLAKNVAAVTIFVATEKMQSEDSLCAALAPLIDKTEKYVRDKLARGGVCPIVSVLPDEFSDETQDAILAIPGVGIDRKSFSTIRVYPFGKTLAHTLGYVGGVSEKELEKLNAEYPGQFTADSQVGKSGLELAYETELRGVDGREYYIADENNKKKSTLYVRPAKDGLDLHLNIDVGLQQRLEEVMVYSLSNEQTGAAIALNPKTGAIKALCSYPGYDPNLFVRGISEANYKQLETDKNLPMFNRLTQGLFPPGSIIKPFTASAALETGAITPNTVFKGEIVDDRWIPTINGRPWYYPPIKRVAIRYRPSPLNLQNAIITSDNIFFAFAAMETQKEPFLSFLDKLGMNTPIPFDLPIAKPHVHNEGVDFDIKLLADSGYGQGEILLSPVQMAAMYTALQDGNIMVPQLVKEIYETSGNDYTVQKKFEPTVWIQNAIQPETARMLEPMLEKVMTEGTGYTLGMRGRRLAGKTGTAQVGSREVSWLAVYTLDRDEPLLAITVIDTNGGLVKFDIVREILQYRGN